MEPKPRIAVVTSYFPTREEPYRGHSAYQTVRRMSEWARIEAFCPLPEYPAGLPFRPRETRYQRFSVDWSPEDVPVRYFLYPSLPLVTRPIHGLEARRAVMPSLRQFAPDLILSYWLYPDGWAAVSAGRELGVPVVVGALGSDVRRIGDPVTRWWTRKTLNEADFVLTVSRELRQQVIEIFRVPADKTRAILNGCDTGVFRPSSRQEARAALGIEQEAQLILYVGTLIPSKGLGELWEAFRALSSERHGVRLTLIGEGPLQSVWKGRAPSGSIAVPGKCSSHEVARWLAACDVFCLPSYSEGCPNVVIEALSAGRPVVGTAVGGIPELVTPANGLLVPVGDAVGLAEALKVALDRDWDGTAIARDSERSWRKVAEETWEICSRLLR